MEAEHTALEVADKLIRLAREAETPITPLQVQKLTYFCHAWRLGLGDGPLFQDAVEAWQHGPVIRAVYHALKHHGGHPILQPALSQPADFRDLDEKLIRAVWGMYGHLDGNILSRMTHAEGSPWDQVYRRNPQSQIIHEHIIRNYFGALIAARQSSA